MPNISRTLKVLFFYNSIFMFAAKLLGPLYAIFVGGIGGSVMMVSVSWAVFIGSATFFSIIIARIGDRIRHKRKLLAMGYLVSAIAWFGYLFVGSITGLLIVQIILGLGDALAIPSFDTIFAEHIDKKIDVREYADWNIILNIAVMIGTLVGGLIVTRFGFDHLFTVMGVLALLASIGVAIQPRHVLD
ncbi:MAG: MFS transporter [Parcubacteria group bacterium]